MEHIAILKKTWLAKILSGEKTIESRWYKQKRTPYHNIAKGDMLYLKETGKPVTAKAAVKDVMFFDHLTEEKTRRIIQEYGSRIGMTEESLPRLQGKNYCTLIFLEQPQKIHLFQINKKGYGMMAAWITVDSIEKLKVKRNI